MKNATIRRSNQFRLMKNDKKFDLMNSTSWKNEFRSHEIRPPDPEPTQRHFNWFNYFRKILFPCSFFFGIFKIHQMFSPEWFLRWVLPHQSLLPRPSGSMKCNVPKETISDFSPWAPKSYRDSPRPKDPSTPTLPRNRVYLKRLHHHKLYSLWISNIMQSKNKIYRKCPSFLVQWYLN